MYGLLQARVPLMPPPRCRQAPPFRPRVISYKHYAWINIYNESRKKDMAVTCRESEGDRRTTISVYRFQKRTSRNSNVEQVSFYATFKYFHESVIVIKPVVFPASSKLFGQHNYRSNNKSPDKAKTYKYANSVEERFFYIFSYLTYYFFDAHELPLTIRE